MPPAAGGKNRRFTGLSRSSLLWADLGCLSAAPRLSLGCPSAAPRLPLGCTSAAPRPHLGCLSAVSRLSLGCLSAAPRLPLGCTSAASRPPLGYNLGLERRHRGRELQRVGAQDGGGDGGVEQLHGGRGGVQQRQVGDDGAPGVWEGKATEGAWGSERGEGSQPARRSGGETRLQRGDPLVSRLGLGWASAAYLGCRARRHKQRGRRRRALPRR